MNAGLTTAGKRKLHEVAQRAVADRSVPGLVALAARGGDVQLEAAGVMADRWAPRWGPAVAGRAVSRRRAPARAGWRGPPRPGSSRHPG
jgi:hypothetical protein